MCVVHIVLDYECITGMWLSASSCMMQLSKLLKAYAPINNLDKCHLIKIGAKLVACNQIMLKTQAQIIYTLQYFLLVYYHLMLNTGTKLKCGSTEISSKTKAALRVTF